MTNKCPKCGYEYENGDIFCSRCGNKLSFLKEENNLKIVEQSGNFLLDNLKEIVDANNSKNQRTNIPKLTDNLSFNLAISLIIVSLLLVGVVFFIIKGQNAGKESMHYKSLISNPARIPRLKEPQNYDELKDNLAEVENFLGLYLENSTNSIDKKEQIFASFLNEMDKLPHITNENVILDKSHPCYNITSSQSADICSQKLNKDFKSVGIKAYSNYNVVYLYPDYKFIKKKYSKYLSSEYKKFVNLNAKYNLPVSVGLNLYIEPVKLADKIYDFEKLYNSADNSYVKEKAEYIIFDNFIKFIFTPSIYDTTTHEMEEEFKNAYIYFTKAKKNSALYSVILSYLDKKRSYSEENFKNDYPYKQFEFSFEENVKNNMLNDVFAQLRKNIFSDNSDFIFGYIYNSLNGKWIKYNQNIKIGPNDFVLSEPDENNNVTVYNSMFAPSQELNISKYGKLYIINGLLYIFNSDKLQLSKIAFSGRNFSIRTLSINDITSLFPGIEVINIDSYSNYNIYIEKDNRKANYIILSRYSQGYSQYVVNATKGQIKNLILPNMFSVDSLGDVTVAFHAKDINTDEIAENSPTYKFIIHTFGYQEPPKNEELNYAQYDEKTANEEDEEEKDYKPNIMPKVNDKNSEDDNILKTPPSQILEPPKDGD